MNYCNPEGWKNEVRMVKESSCKDEFFAYFDGPKGGTTDQVFKKGEDVFTRLMLPYAKKYLDNLKTKVSLDIGYGSGSQVLAASKIFGLSLGIDVHDVARTIGGELNLRKAQNFKLYTSDGQYVPLEDGHVDFIHSWVTFIHLETIVKVQLYLEDIFRVLKPGGIGVIFFGRLIRSGKSQSWGGVERDIEKEESIPLGYREGGPKSKVRCISIVMSMWKMENLLKSIGFDLFERTASFDGEGKSRVYHGQYGVVFRKPKAEPEVRHARRSMIKNKA